MANEDFIARIAPIVKRYAPDYGICCPSAVIAQAINESGWGESRLARDYHNYFGMKCGTKWTGPSVNMATQEEYQPGTLTAISDNFRVYSSMEDGVRGYFEFIQLARYQNLRGITDPRTYLQTIKDDGYATSSTYVDNCMALVDQYGLAAYDTNESEGSMAVYLAQASCDENGRYVGGQAGNQSGTELNIRGYYSSSGNPWKCYRPKDATVAKKIAENASGAVANRNIGYDQNERNTIRAKAQKVNLVLSAINEACECDCMSLAGECAICAGASDAILFEGNNLPWTGNAHEKLMATGMFDCKGSGLSESQLCVGDILVRDGHAVIVVSGKAATGSSSTQTVVSGTIEELARAIWTGRITETGEARRKLLGDKYDAVQAKIQELYYGGKPVESTPTSTKPATNTIRPGTYKVLVDGLRVRSAPRIADETDTGKHYDAGELIYSVASDIVEADGWWWAHYSSYSGKTRYVAMSSTDGTKKYLAMV